MPLLAIVRVELVSLDPVLVRQLALDPRLLFQLDPGQFEELICDRLSAMGLEARRTGRSNRKDGGIDILFWPRRPTSFPFLGAAQVKHHRRVDYAEGPSTVRDFVGATSALPINSAILVTNATFSPDAQWFARERAKLLRLRQFEDVRRWLAGNFTDDVEWREIPDLLELCPGVIIRIR